MAEKMTSQNAQMKVKIFRLKSRLLRILHSAWRRSNRHPPDVAFPSQKNSCVSLECFNWHDAQFYLDVKWKPENLFRRQHSRCKILDWRQRKVCRLSTKRWLRWQVAHARNSRRTAYLSRTPRVLCRGTICPKLPGSLCWRREWRRKAPSAGSRNFSKRLEIKSLGD